MATKKNIAVVMALLKSIYPYFAKDVDMGVLANAWLLLLNEYDDKVINNAVALCLKECVTPPTPAHIIKKIEDMQPQKSNSELWSELILALQKIDTLQDGWQYYSQEQKEDRRKKCEDIYNSLEEEIKFYVGSYGEMIRMSRQIDDENLKYLKTNFLKTMPDIRKQYKMSVYREKNSELLDKNGKWKFIENI